MQSFHICCRFVQLPRGKLFGFADAEFFISLVCVFVMPFIRIKSMCLCEILYKINFWFYFSVIFCFRFTLRMLSLLSRSEEQLRWPILARFEHFRSLFFIWVRSHSLWHLYNVVKEWPDQFLHNLQFFNIFLFVDWNISFW